MKKRFDCYKFLTVFTLFLMPISISILIVMLNNYEKYDSISKEIGVSAPTVKEWVTILERSGIIFILRPYYSNISKRLVKTPKCYFLDTGLASYLTRWPTYETLMNGNASGAFFETFVVGEILKSYYNNGKEPNIYYYRDIDKKEIDLIMLGAGQIQDSVRTGQELLCSRKTRAEGYAGSGPLHGR